MKMPPMEFTFQPSPPAKPHRKKHPSGPVRENAAMQLSALQRLRSGGRDDLWHTAQIPCAGSFQGQHTAIGMRNHAARETPAVAGKGNGSSGVNSLFTPRCNQAALLLVPSIAFHSSALSFTPTDATFSSRCSTDDVPGMGRITGE